MPLTKQQLHDLAGQAQAGEFYSLSPGLADYGRNLQKDANLKLVTEQKHKNRMAERSPISLGRGILVDPNTGEVTNVSEYQQAVEAEERRKAEAAAQVYQRETADEQRAAEIKHAQALELQAQKDAAALERERIKSGRRTASENEKRISAEQTIAGMEHLLQIVDQNPDAFGPLSDITAYMGEGTPKLITETISNIQQGLRSEGDIQARASLFSVADAMIHELAGAQQSAHEENRILRHVPKSTDTATAIRAKLNAAIQQARIHQSIRDRESRNLADRNRGYYKGVDTGLQEGIDYIDDTLPDGTTWRVYSDGRMEQIQ